MSMVYSHCFVLRRPPSPLSLLISFARAYPFFTVDNWSYCNSVTQSLLLEIVKSGQFIYKSNACLPNGVVVRDDAITCFGRYSVRTGEALNFTWMEQTTSSTVTDNFGVLSMEWSGEIEAALPNQLRFV